MTDGMFSALWGAAGLISLALIGVLFYCAIRPMVKGPFAISTRAALKFVFLFPFLLLLLSLITASPWIWALLGIFFVYFCANWPPRVVLAFGVEKETMGAAVAAALHSLELAHEERGPHLIVLGNGRELSVLVDGIAGSGTISMQAWPDPLLPARIAAAMNEHFRAAGHSRRITPLFYYSLASAPFIGISIPTLCLLLRL